MWQISYTMWLMPCKEAECGIFSHGKYLGLDESPYIYLKIHFPLNPKLFEIKTLGSDHLDPHSS